LEVAVDPETPEEAPSVPILEEGDPVAEKEELRPPIAVAVLVERLVEVPLWSNILEIRKGEPTSKK
jgi:hypothetical protein